MPSLTRPISGILKVDKQKKALYTDSADDFSIESD